MASINVGTIGHSDDGTGRLVAALDKVMINVQDSDFIIAGGAIDKTINITIKDDYFGHDHNNDSWRKENKRKGVSQNKRRKIARRR